MKMFCLWLVNHLLALIIIVLVLGGLVLQAVPSLEDLDNQSFKTFVVVAAIVGFIPAILTAKFAKANFDEMISNDFVQWTSSTNLWLSEWKFFFKTLFLGWLFYGIIVFHIEIIFGALFGFF